MKAPEGMNEAVVALSSEPQEPTLPRPVQDALGERLRSMYEAIKAEPVPDRLVTLLQQIEQRSSKE